MTLNSNFCYACRPSKVELLQVCRFVFGKAELKECSFWMFGAGDKMNIIILFCRFLCRCVCLCLCWSVSVLVSVI